MRLYRFEGADARSPVSEWVAESEEYRNMIAASGRWFTDSLDEALWYSCDHESGIVVSLDVEDELAERWRVSNLPSLPGERTVPDNPSAWSLRPNREFYLPREIAMMAAPFDPGVFPETEEAALRM